MLDSLAIASTLLSVAIFLYLRFGIRNYLKKIVHSEFQIILAETERLRAEEKQDSSCQDSK